MDSERAERAHVWADELRAIVDDLTSAVAAGRISAEIRATAAVSEVVLSVLAEIDALPPTGEIGELATMRSPGYIAWAHFHRAARQWVDALSDEGRIARHADPDARAFDAWLLAAAAAQTLAATSPRTQRASVA